MEDKNATPEEEVTEPEATQEEESHDEPKAEQPEAPSGQPCPHCGGTGLKDFATAGNAAVELCKECEGSGKIL